MPSVTYTAERIHVVENQIDSLLCLSRRERGELRRRLIDDFRESAEQEIRANQEDEIVEEVTGQLEQELGQSPTDEQIEEAVDKRVDELVDERQVDFEENTLPEQLHAAIARVLRFDLSPEEMIERQLAGVVFLDGKEIIIRENADGSVTPYYRDRPDADPTDNLVALPRYSPPYEPPG